MSGYGIVEAPSRPVWKAVVTVIVAVLGPPCAVVAAFLGAIAWSGCFLSCDPPNHPLGAGLLLLAVGLLISGPVLAWFLIRRASWVIGTIAFPIAAGLVLFGRLLGFHA